MECTHNFNSIDGFMTCISCGIIDIHRPVFIDGCLFKNYKNYHLYHRKIYFLEKLRLISGRKQSLNEKYNEMIIHLQKESFNTIHDLRKLMKKHKFSTFYKYIHSVYYDLKKIKLIHLSLTEIEFLVKKFLIIEREFKSKYVGKKNILSYNIIIFALFKKYHPDYSKFLILPKNNKKISEKIIELLINIEDY